MVPLFQERGKLKMKGVCGGWRVEASTMRTRINCVKSQEIATGTRATVCTFRRPSVI